MRHQQLGAQDAPSRAAYVPKNLLGAKSCRALGKMQILFGQAIQVLPAAGGLLHLTRFVSTVNKTQQSHEARHARIRYALAETPPDT